MLVLDGDLRAAHLAVAAGRGWIPLARARASAPPPGTAAIPLHRFLIHVNAVVLWRRGERRPVVRTVLEAIFAAARRHPAQCVAPDQPLPPATVLRGPPRRVASFLPPGLEVRHLRALLEVAATQTIGRAAERLGVSQPALSRQLRELEEMLALPLLERSARGVALAPAGASLAGDCPEVLVALDRLVQETGRARRGHGGALHRGRGGHRRRVGAAGARGRRVRVPPPAPARRDRGHGNAAATRGAGARRHRPRSGPRVPGAAHGEPAPRARLRGPAAGGAAECASSAGGEQAPHGVASWPMYRSCS